MGHLTSQSHSLSGFLTSLLKLNCRDVVIQSSARGYFLRFNQSQNIHVFTGIGVGDSHASPTTALLLTVLQESMGRIATILFAHRLGTSLEPECKMYRLAADIFNDAAMLLDCLSPALPKASRVALLSLSSILRSLCGVAAGSSKASLSAHFATQGNLGELNAVWHPFSQSSTS
jgi:hypothetical protein